MYYRNEQTLSVAGQGEGAGRGTSRPASSLRPIQPLPGGRASEGAMDDQLGFGGHASRDRGNPGRFRDPPHRHLGQYLSQRCFGPAGAVPRGSAIFRNCSRREGRVALHPGLQGEASPREVCPLQSRDAGQALLRGRDGAEEGGLRPGHLAQRLGSPPRNARPRREEGSSGLGPGIGNASDRSSSRLAPK